MSTSPRRAVAALTSVVLLATLASQVPAAAAGDMQKPQQDAPIAGQRVPAKSRPADPTEVASARTTRQSSPVWPTASTVDVQLESASAPARTGGSSRAGSLPIFVSQSKSNPPAGLAQVRVRVLERAAAKTAGVDGLVLSVQRSDGKTAAAKADVSIDYSGFSTAYGGSWAARLRMVLLPECALTTPTVRGCLDAKELKSTNDIHSRRVTATIPLPEQTKLSKAERDNDTIRATRTIVALTAGEQGSDGNYAATALGSSATWSAGGSSGDFSWSYGMRVPPSLGGPAPAIGLTYSSQAVDGRTAATNNQPSWIGEGFDWQPGYIERRYKPCSDDMTTAGHNNSVKTGDLCWVTDNAVLSLPGHAGELLKDGSDPNRWHLRNDDGSLILRKTGAANGARDGEWWVLVDTTGTQYWFGGQSSTSSVWTVPVFGNNPGEPCHQTSYAASSCLQGWRFNLDHVVDIHGNTMSYTYAKETNKYGRNISATDVIDYDRGGYLDHIDYGTRTGGSGAAPMQVKFDVAERCINACAKTDPATYPDTPVDQECTGSPCLHFGPTFWSTKRLSQVTTKVWDAAAQPPAHRDVERWTLTHTFPDPGDSSRAGLWLSRISHVGLAGPTAALPDIVFSGVQLQNRVDTLQDQLFPMNWWRISRIDSEFGGALIVNYKPQECAVGTVMPDVNALHNNTLRCFPVRWTPDGFDDPIIDFFHKYVVGEVKEGDLTGQAPDVVHRYEYVGGAAWRYTDDDGLIKAEDKTWSQWRGYATVRARTGDAVDTTPTFTETQYFRGMHGDHLPSGTRGIALPAIDMNGNGTMADSGIDVPSANDEDAYAGRARIAITFNGAARPEVSAKAYQHWQSAPTATRTINGVTVTARVLGTSGIYTRTALDNDHGQRQAGWRTTSVTTTFDSLGMPIKVDDRGDNAVADDQKCVLTDYIRNMDPANSIWLTTMVKRVRTFAADCETAEGGNLTEAHILGEEKSSYDEQPYGTAPVKGKVTESQLLNTYIGGVASYLTVGRTKYDSHGRVTDVWDVDNRHRGTAYVPATGGPVTQVISTNQNDWTTKTTLDPAWGTATKILDINDKRTDVTHDGLGRTTAVWLPGQSKDAGHQATTTYAYTVRIDGTNATTTNKLNPAGNGYISSLTLVDGLLRTRQIQAPDTAVAGARVVADTLYDSAGRAVKTTSPYTMTGAPTPDLYTPKPPDYSGPEALPGWTITIFDGAGRVTDNILYSRNLEKWRTHSSYGGDRTDITPPAGGIATSTIVDAAGNTIQTRQYHGPTPTGNYDSVSQRRNNKGQLDRVTDAAGNKWEYQYDLRGRQTQIDDPDHGRNTLTYYDNGSLKTSTDARNVTLAYTYDSLGRKTSLRNGSITGTVLADWTYDAVLKGQRSKSTRYIPNGAGTDAYSTEVLSYSERYQPGIVRYSLPASETGFGATTFTYTNFYNTSDGSQSGARIPAAGGLALETINVGYSNLGLPQTLSSGAGTLVTATSYTNYGEPAIITLRNGSGPIAQIGQYYHDDGTRRLKEIKTTSAAVPTTYADLNYTYDAAGNITRIADVTSGDNQCFRYDYLRRLKDGWTPAINDDCAANPTVGALSGPAKYWHTYSYDAVGNRQTFTDHITASDANHTYPAPQTSQAHTLTKIDYTGPAAWTANYTYDATGNTVCRPSAAATNDCTTASASQTLSWDLEGRLDTLTDTTGATRYIYDADGNRLIRKDPTGKTLYLPNQEIRYTNGGTTTCTRYYEYAGKTIATRTNTSGSLSWLSANHQDTTSIAITANNQTTATRWNTPFGTPRGSGSGTWPASMDKGLVGGTKDNTGTTHLGAREYDPTLGRFLSVDPIMTLSDPQQWNPYTYSGNSPITYSDPSGLVNEAGDAGGPGGGGIDPSKCTQKGCPGDDPGPASLKSALISYGFTLPNGTHVDVLVTGDIMINGYIVPQGPNKGDPYEIGMKFDGYGKNMGAVTNHAQIAGILRLACTGSCRGINFMWLDEDVMTSAGDCEACPLLVEAGILLAVGRATGGLGGRPAPRSGGAGIKIGEDLYQHPDGSIRNSRGEYAGTNGTRSGSAAEKKAMAGMKADGVKVIEHPVAVRGNDGQLRIYDFGIDLGHGRVIGVEVKSGSATRGPEQRSFDNWIHNGGIGTGVGKATGQEVVGVIEVRMP